MLKNIKRSLKDLLGAEYMNAVKSVAVTVNGMAEEEADALINEEVEFLPDTYVFRMQEMAKKTGERVVEPFVNDTLGAPTEAYRKAAHLFSSPVGGVGCTRIGEDGRAYLIAKSEHYHASLGHNFPGYKLITNARALGILNATHNNTRGYITRLCEERIIASANGVSDDKVSEVISSEDPRTLNRIINLETGSLAVEAGIKMMLSRFYRLDATYDAPEYDGKIPVFLVMEDNREGLCANYHGTTVTAQTFRGMWPELYEKILQNRLYKVVSVKKNDIGDFEEKIRRYNSGSYKTAGFLHEIILMNYSGIRLTPEFLQKAYELCLETDTLTLCDEIQSCMWYDGMFLFKKYSLSPDFAVIGKGFPGGEYPASKILTNRKADILNQFGALVTNGQEELASLAYLITMEFSRENGEEITRMGEYIERGIEELAREFPTLVDKAEGLGHLAAIHFEKVEDASRFTKLINDKCVDISAQLYKADCPPGALLKPPLIADEVVIDVMLSKVRECLSELT